MDQEAAMKAVIDIFLQITFHRLCKWHYINKLGDKIGKMYKKQEGNG